VAADDARRAALLAVMPAVFVLIWSTGFVVARLGMPHAPPMTFLAWRFAFSVAAFLAWIAWARVPWPRDPRQWAHLAVVGVLMHTCYLGGVWAAVKAGMSAGTAALIVGLQPILTALWLSSRQATQRATPAQWLGLVLGLAGLTLVVWRKLGLGEASAPTILLAVGALLGITIGTLYQKRHVKPADVRTANAIQLMAALVVALPLAALETEPVQWVPQMIGAMAWSVLVLTLGGSSLLVLLIQRGAATQVTSLLYLVPPCTAVMAWLLFGEALTGLVLAGMGLTALGVWLVVRQARP
jgi:drug/metabolite transporter (DMT)-like permease